MNNDEKARQTNLRNRAKPTLTQHLVQNEQQRKGKNNRAFLLAQLDEITEALSAGWNLRAIWELLHSKGEFPGSYDTFVKGVRLEQAKQPTPVLKTRKDEHPPVTLAQSNKSTQPSSEFSYPTDMDKSSLF